MLNLRMLGIAAAILLGMPILADALPNDVPEDPADWPAWLFGKGDEAWNEVFNETWAEVQAEANATVRDVRMATLPPPVTGRTGDLVGEQLVEGHTTFVTLDIQVWRNVTEGSFDIAGYVECSHRVSGRTENGLPSSIDYVSAECRLFERVYIAPNTTRGPWTWFTPYQSTGNFYPYTMPNGMTDYMEEFTFTASGYDADGRYVEETLYAWAAPIHRAWLSPVDARPANFLAPLPEDRLREMGLERFDVLLQDDPRVRFA